MKKLIIITMIMVLLPMIALADYSSRLGMTMNEYITKYNSISAPLDSPYQKLSSPYLWTPFNGYKVAWFKPSKQSSVVLLLLSKDPAGKNDLSCGLDMIQICADNGKDFIDLIGITGRSGEPVSGKLFSTSICDMRISQLLRYYYENGYKGTGKIAYWSISDDDSTMLAFFEADGWYTFQICSVEDLQ